MTTLPLHGAAEEAWMSITPLQGTLTLFAPLSGMALGDIALWNSRRAKGLEESAYGSNIVYPGAADWSEAWQ